MADSDLQVNGLCVMEQEIAQMISASDVSHPLKKEIAKWVYMRFSRDMPHWKSNEPDLDAINAADISQEAIVMVASMDEDVRDMIDAYLNLVVPVEWAMLMAVLVSEMQVRSKVMERVKDFELDADKQQRAYMLKCDLSEKLIEMRERNKRLTEEIIGTGEIGFKAARAVANAVKQKVTAEGMSRAIS